MAALGLSPRHGIYHSAGTYVAPAPPVNPHRTRPRTSQKHPLRRRLVTTIYSEVWQLAFAAFADTGSTQIDRIVIRITEEAPTVRTLYS